MKAILYLIQKEFRQIFRDRPMTMMIFALPLVQLYIFSFAIQTDVKNVRLAVYDQDRSAASRNLVNSFYTSGYFIPTRTPESPADLKHMLQRGQADITLWIPPDYTKKLADGPSATVGLNIDGQNSSLAGRARGYAEAIILREAYRLIDEKRLEHPELELKAHRIEEANRFFYNPELESRFYMLPGIVVMIVTIISAMLTGMAIVKEKEIGTLEQLMVTPLTPLQLIAGKTIPFLILGYFELAMATFLVVVSFKLPLIGSLWLLAGCSLAYLTVTLGMGLLASTVSQTQQQAMLTVWFFLIFGILMSGFFFPVENMPRGVYLMTFLNPMRYYIEIVRCIFLKAATFKDLLHDIIPLCTIGLAIFSTAVWQFRKRTA
jgi:ABC-2 type transport system permease protein